MARFIFALLVSVYLAAQNTAPFIELPGQPTPHAPICADLEGTTAVLEMREGRILLENFKFKKPWFGTWQISFNVRNRTDHQLEGVSLQFIFYNRAGEMVSDPGKVPAHRIGVLQESETASLPVQVAIPTELRPAKGKDADQVKVYLISFKARMNQEDIARAEKERLRKAQEERAAALKAEQDRIEAEAKAKREREEEERVAAEVAAQTKRDATQRAAEAVRRKKEADAQKVVTPTTQASTAASPTPASPKGDEGDPLAGIGWTIAGFSALSICFGIAYSASGFSRARKKARDAVASVERLDGAIRSIQLRAAEKFTLAARNHVNQIHQSRLAAIPIEELKPLAPGARLQLLRGKGIRTLLDLKGFSAQSLMTIKGIGPDSAARITAAAASLAAKAIGVPIPLPLPGTPNGPERAMLDAIYQHYQVERLLADPNGLVGARLKS